jgi:hypothetical protein
MFKVDGKEYSAEDLKAALTARDALTEAEAERDKALARADSTAREDSIRKDEAAKVRARVELETKARPHLPADFTLDAADDDSIRGAVITALEKDADLDGKSGAYLAARMDLALQAHASRVDHTGNARPLPHNVTGGQRKDAADDWTNSRNDLLGYHRKLWATPSN